MRTEEGKVKDKVREILDDRGAYYFMPVQMGYGSATLDFLCCIKGIFVAIETKRPGGAKLTLRQQSVLNAVLKAGGIALVVDNPDVLKTELDRMFK